MVFNRFERFKSFKPPALPVVTDFHIAKLTVFSSLEKATKSCKNVRIYDKGEDSFELLEK